MTIAAGTVANKASQDLQIAEAGSFHLGTNDHPGISIVAAPFSGKNYLTWSTSMKISLGAKDKLGFIDGSITKPGEDSSEYSSGEGQITWSDPGSWDH